MNDILPEQTPLWRYFEGTVANLLDGYGYRQIRMPIVEFTELFKRSIGEVTDIVEKEMYTFDDRNGDSLTLRPEGTAACVRAVLEHGLAGGGQTQKLWYIGPMFRHERPQKGRYRQFHQIGVEVFNIDGPDIDAELIVLTWRLWGLLGIRDAVTLELNSLGTSAARARQQVAGDPGAAGRCAEDGGFPGRGVAPAFRWPEGPPGCRWHSLCDQPQAGAWPGLLQQDRVRVGDRSARCPGHGLCRRSLRWPGRADGRQADAGRGFRHGHRASGVVDRNPGQGADSNRPAGRCLSLCPGRAGGIGCPGPGRTLARSIASPAPAGQCRLGQFQESTEEGRQERRALRLGHG